MKRRLMTMFVLLSAISCSKPSADPDADNSGTGGQEPAPAVEYDYTLTGTCGTVGTKVSIGEVSEGLWPFNWDNRDKVSLFGTDGALVANLALSAGQGTPQGTFLYKTSEQVSAPVRVVYPYGRDGPGQLPSLQEVDGSNLSDIRGRCHFYTGELSLAAGETTAFEMVPALAMIRIDVLCNGAEGDANLTEVSIVRSGAALSGDYEVDYQTGAVTPGAETSDNVTVSFYNVSPLVSQDVCQVWVAVLPCGQEQEYTLSLNIAVSGKTAVVERTFNAVLTSDAVTAVDMTDVNLDASSTGDAGSFEDNVVEPIKK